MKCAKGYGTWECVMKVQDGGAYVVYPYSFGNGNPVEAGAVMGGSSAFVTVMN
jgi:hypothetical protein